MSTSQVRISENTHLAIKGIASQTGETMQGVVERAVERYRRDLFLDDLNRDFGALKEKEADWSAELQERIAWDATLTDGEIGE